MTTLDNRDDRFENEFAHNAEVKFKVEARRNKLVGLWAAGKLALEGQAADDYAKSVIMADLEEPGDEDVFRKLRGDLDGAMSAISDDEIREKMTHFLTVAKDQIREGI